MRILVAICLFGFILSECDNLNALQCSSNTDCEWIEDIESGHCSNFNNSNQCNNYSQYGCYWYDHWYYSGWDSCSGGSWYIDNSYCQENPNPPTCSEMSQTQCNNNSDCEWVENIETENCHDILDCTGGCTWQDCVAIEGCWWHFGTAYYDPSGCYGEHETDNSYCEDAEYQLGDLNLDSAINIQDVIIIINLILNGEFDLVADINLDSTVNVLDVIQLVNIILNN